MSVPCKLAVTTIPSQLVKDVGTDINNMRNKQDTLALESVSGLDKTKDAFPDTRYRIRNFLLN